MSTKTEFYLGLGDGGNPVWASTAAEDVNGVRQAFDQLFTTGDTVEATLDKGSKGEYRVLKITVEVAAEGTFDA